MSVQLLQHLYAALASEHGIVLHTEDPEALKRKLYPLRKQDPRLEELSICTSPHNPATELWLVKKDALNAPEE